jgi:hypothetical protein
MRMPLIHNTDTPYSFFTTTHQPPLPITTHQSLLPITITNHYFQSTTTANHHYQPLPPIKTDVAAAVADEVLKSPFDLVFHLSERPSPGTVQLTITPTGGTYIDAAGMSMMDPTLLL